MIHKSQIRGRAEWFLLVVTWFAKLFLILLLCAYIMFPLFWMLSTSLKTLPESMLVPIAWFPRKATAESYISMWVTYPFALYFRNSFLVSCVSAFAATFVGALAGYGLSRFRWRWRTILMGAFLTSQMISGAVIIGPYFKILAKLGLYDKLAGLTVALTTISLPFCVWMAKGYFDTIPRELDEAALVDGCTRFRAFLLVVGPLAAPGLVVAFLFSFLLAWQDLLWAMTISATESTRTVTMALAFMVGQFRVNWPMLMAATLISSIPSVLLYLIFRNAIVSGLTAGAVKQ